MQIRISTSWLSNRFKIKRSRMKKILHEPPRPNGLIGRTPWPADMPPTLTVSVEIHLFTGTLSRSYLHQFLPEIELATLPCHSTIVVTLRTLRRWQFLSEVKFATLSRDSPIFVPMSRTARRGSVPSGSPRPLWRTTAAHGWTRALAPGIVAHATIALVLLAQIHLERLQRIIWRLQPATIVVTSVAYRCPTLSSTLRHLVVIARPRLSVASPIRRTAICKLHLIATGQSFLYGVCSSYLQTERG